MKRSSVLLILGIALGLLLVSVDGKMSNKVKNFLKTSGVGKQCKMRGWNDEQCIKHLKAVCGMQDISNPEENDELKACLQRERCGEPLVSETGNRTARQSLSYKFQKRQLTWMVYNTPPKTTLTKSQIETMTEHAVGVWACYSQLTFSRARSLRDADIVVMFSPRQHDWVHYRTKQIQRGSDGSPFDGPGGTLAHAFYPVGDKTGNLHMDNYEKWSGNLNPGSLNTFVTLVHEIGHNLGLPHSRSGQDIMAPFYRSMREGDLDLGSWETRAIQSLYGSRSCTSKRWQQYFNRIYPKRGSGSTSSNTGGGATKPKPGRDHPSCAKYTKDICWHDWMKTNCKNMCSSRFFRRDIPAEKKNMP